MPLLRVAGWFALSVVAAAPYGIANDQVTATISPEYFSVFKRAQFAYSLEALGLLDAPMRIQAVVVGVLSTWWFGLFLGIVLAMCGIVGRHPPLPTSDFARAILGIMGATLALSIVCGGVAYVLAGPLAPDASGWPFLAGIRETRRAFAVGWWQGGAYLGGFLATIAAGLRVQALRARLTWSGRATPERFTARATTGRGDGVVS